MGPERILPNSEEDVVQDRPLDTAVPEEWSGEDMEEEEDEGGAGDEDSAGYYYQPLNQDPDGMNNSHTEPADEGTIAEQLQDVQDRIEVQEVFGVPDASSAFWLASVYYSTKSDVVIFINILQAMGLFLPQPPPDSDEEEDPEGAAACRSHASIPMDAGKQQNRLYIWASTLICCHFIVSVLLSVFWTKISSPKSMQLALKNTGMKSTIMVILCAYSTLT